jgi:uncharacterized protein YecE (DUF72 family)
VETALANFFASGPLALGEKLGPVVWQLPSSMRYDEPRLDVFLALLPRTTSAAARLAKKHDHRVKHGSHTRITRDRKLRHARDASRQLSHPAWRRRRRDVYVCWSASRASPRAG